MYKRQVSLLILAVGGCRSVDKPYQKTIFALDTIIDVTVYGADAETAVKFAVEEMTRLELLLSNYHPDSEISRINRNAGGTAVAISLETEKVLEKALRYAELTNGAFDPTIGPIVELWGIGKKNNFVPDESQIKAALSLVDYRRVELDKVKHNVRLPLKGMSLDVGGIAKGFILDRMTEILKQKGITSALINGGGDIRTIGKKHDGSPWRIGLQNPRKTDAIAAKISMMKWNAVDTSGDYQRFFERDGMRYHHIFDPATGKPTQTLTSASLIYSEGVVDLLPSNVLLVVGKEKSLLLLAKFSGLEAIFVDVKGAISFTPGLNSNIEVDR